MAPDTSRMDSAPRAVFATEWVRGRTKRTGAKARRPPRVLSPTHFSPSAVAPRSKAYGPILAANLGDLTLGTQPSAERKEREETSPYATILCRRSSYGVSQTSRSGVSGCGALVRFYFHLWLPSVRPLNHSLPLSLSICLSSTSMCKDHELADKIPYAPTAHNTIVAAQATKFPWRRAATLQVDLESRRRRLQDKGLG
ncbi:hypothetical protein B0H19DRAFT_1385978 [Mycena capillaripes]|nr:hypothetical protein B0H19DRAFT_1385978 [Mycena capillaripes]